MSTASYNALRVWMSMFEIPNAWMERGTKDSNVFQAETVRAREERGECRISVSMYVNGGVSRFLREESMEVRIWVSSGSVREYGRFLGS